ncbi:MAG TPA: PadR family transcriptional regulator [Candidatus Angelobacter sp.]|nr:PadR family transcriptional regulator [Candidatus Angelobacter sp.]
MTDTTANREWKKGSTELLVLSLVEGRPRHGYEIAKLIQARSQGALRFHAASLYPLLYRLERKGLIEGRWVEKAGQRRRRCYTLTLAGRNRLAEQRRGWRAFIRAVGRVARVAHA